MLEDNVLKVGSKTDAKKLAGAITHALKEQGGRAAMRAIGPAAVNQAIKGFAISREYVAPTGNDLICVLGFEDVEVEGEKRTAIKFGIEPHDRRISKEDIPIEDILKVSGHADEAAAGYSKKMAGAIAHALDESEDGKAVLQAIGAAAVSNTIKAICIARGYKASQGHDIICVPGFTDIEIDGEKRTAIRFYVEYR